MKPEDAQKQLQQIRQEREASTGYMSFLEKFWELQVSFPFLFKFLYSCATGNVSRKHCHLKSLRHGCHLVLTVFVYW